MPQDPTKQSCCDYVEWSDGKTTHLSKPMVGGRPTHASAKSKIAGGAVYAEVYMGRVKTHTYRATGVEIHIGSR